MASPERFPSCLASESYTILIASKTQNDQVLNFDLAAWTLNFVLWNKKKWLARVFMPVQICLLANLVLSVVRLRTSADILYMVKITTDFTWTLIIESNISLDKNELLNSHSLCSVKNIIRALSVLDWSKVCVGKFDDKFSRLKTKWVIRSLYYNYG